MKINSISKNQSFGALMLEKKEITPTQRFIVENAVEAILDKKCNIYLLEHKFSDLYISPNNDGKSVDLKILSAAGYTYNYIPHDKNGELRTKIHLIESNRPLKKVRNRMANNIKLRVEKFIKRSMDELYGSKENPENIKRRENLEYISATDRESSNLQRKDLLPDADLIYGNSQVTTRDFIK